MSFLKRLFGGGGGNAGEAASGAPARQVEHKGFTVSAAPFKSEGQYQTCGVVSKEIDGVVREHRFIRADRFAGLLKRNPRVTRVTDYLFAGVFSAFALKILTTQAK